MTGEQRARLGLIADVLIPRGDDMPSATDVGAHAAGADRVLAERPDLEAIAERVTGEAFDDAREHVRRLRAADPAAFTQLLELVAGAYFLDDGVAGTLGYRRRVPLALERDDDLDLLTAPVLARGPAYRAV
jgi:hypothetical protein